MLSVMEMVAAQSSRLVLQWQWQWQLAFRRRFSGARQLVPAADPNVVLC